MKTQRRTADEQYQLIMEYRSSGLSDYQWCTEHNINPGTFYNWVKRLRKRACYDSKR
ncbi:MAG: transposase [Dorea sp.]|nr:transposase [Dorea sp.]